MIQPRPDSYYLIKWHNQDSRRTYTTSSARLTKVKVTKKTCASLNSVVNERRFATAPLDWRRAGCHVISAFTTLSVTCFAELSYYLDLDMRKTGSEISTPYIYNESYSEEALHQWSTWPLVHWTKRSASEVDGAKLWARKVRIVFLADFK